MRWQPVRWQRGLTGLTAIAIALAMPAAALATPAWKMQSTPNPTGASWSRLEAVSCKSTSACMAVGTYANGLGEWKPFAEVWEGGEWKLTTVPLPAGATEADLHSVSCTGANECTAVGSSNSASAGPTLAERWNGKWTVQTTVNPPESVNAVFNGVSCTNFTECYAVGGYQNESLLDSFTLVERWNGKTWVIQSAPSPLEGGLASISCKIPAGVFCMAVGTDHGGTFSAYLKGTKWIEEATPNATIYYQQLESVSCLSASNELECTTVGYHLNSLSHDSALAERWNLTEWVVEGPTNGAGTNTILHGVSCPSLTSCVAVGFTGAVSSWQPFAEGWKSSEWLTQTVTSPSGASEARLEGVSCPVATECAAVGSYVNKAGVEVTFAEGYA